MLPLSRARSAERRPFGSARTRQAGAAKEERLESPSTTAVQEESGAKAETEVERDAVTEEAAKRPRGAGVVEASIGAAAEAEAVS